MGYDPYAPSVDGFEGPGVVQDAWFEEDEERGRVVLKLTIYSEDPDVGEVVKQYGIGKDWVIVNDGAAVEHKSGRPTKKFHPQTSVNKLLKACAANGITDGFLRKSGHLPTQAGMWKGLDAEWETLEQSFEDAEGETITYGVVVPVGLNTGTTTASDSNVTTIRKSAVTGAIRDQLVALAQTCDTHDTFIERAYSEVVGVNGDADAEAAVLDPTGIYAEARA